MKVNFFIPKYMKTFKCISKDCTDTCCASWDINIDKNTFNKYENAKGELKSLTDGKYLKNSKLKDPFNYGFMKITKDNKCPFLNKSMLCEIHKRCGEDNLSITCKKYPRVFNIIDGIYEMSGLPSCEEICSMAFLNKEKMEFIEIEEDILEDSIEVYRVIDTEAFIDSDNLIQYFWDIRILSINIMQNRDFSIEERLNTLKSLYEKLEDLKTKGKLYEIETLLDESTKSILSLNKYFDFKTNKPLITNDFFNIILDENLLNKVNGTRLKSLSLNLSKDKTLYKSIQKYNLKSLDNQFDKFSYIFENYLVNQIFKNIIPFDRSCDLNESIKNLINTYKIIKGYLILFNISEKNDISEKNIIYIIQALSKDLEHNKSFKDFLNQAL